MNDTRSSQAAQAGGQHDALLRDLRAIAQRNTYLTDIDPATTTEGRAADVIERLLKMNKHTHLYLHTIDGKPAWFDGQQIVFAETRDHWQDDYSVCRLRESVKEIREDQKRSLAFRKRNGFDTRSQYDFVIVNVAGGSIPWRPK